MLNQGLYREAQTSLNTVRDFLRWGASRFDEAGLFFGHGTDNAWDEAVALISQVLRLPQGVDALILDAALTPTEKAHVVAALRRRIDRREPTPYITGKAWFAGLPFTVDKRVLIPRSPIAELIHNGFHPWLVCEPRRILDMCCGSACIGIALAHAFPDASVVCSDNSDAALEVAADNIALHDVGGQVRCLNSRTWDNFGADDVFDLIVVNPPYVDRSDFENMPAEFEHEPAVALVSGDDGLDFTKEFLQTAAAHLADDGLLVVEVGNSGEALENQFPALPLTWVEFEHGGVGVFVMSKHDALQAQRLL